MAFRRRRKPSVAWLPHVQHDDNTPNLGFWKGTHGVSALGDATTTTILSATLDIPAEANRPNIPSLADFEGSGYRLRRIVGKVFLGYDNNQLAPPTTYPIAALLGVGWIILRVDPTTGAPLLAGTPNAYSPLTLDNNRDPWIWRRTWVLQTDFSNQAAAAQNSWQFPRTNADYGSVQDGPHMDQKTARRVSTEERLFCIISATNISGNADAAVGVRYIIDYRILASPIKVMGNRRNASR